MTWWSRLWAWLNMVTPEPAPEPRTPTQVEREAAQALADMRGNPEPVTPKPSDGLHRMRLHDGQRLHGWIRASPNMVDQNEACGWGLPVRPEADFPVGGTPPQEPQADAVGSA